jgi:Arc/MetJ family transcription regulator
MIAIYKRMTYMRTTLILPEGLVDAARDATGLTSKTETVVYALKEVIRRKRIEGLKSMFGRVDIDLDLEKTRGRRKAVRA